MIIPMVPSNILSAAAFLVTIHGAARADTLADALTNGKAAAEAFGRCDRFVRGWLAHADPETGLIPRNLSDSP